MRPISMISYAQNFEDVMLWRALGHVENGFYIDLGAQDPLIDSVSLAFHEHGWTGIHVEPTPHYAQLLRNQRPGDTVIEAAVGDGPEILTFFEIPDSGISTGDPKIAEQHRERGFKIQEITVPCVRLSSIFKACGKRDIHWMKVDVEGFEFSALKSWGKAAARPWIVIVESTLPMTQIQSHQQWEPLLLRRGYMPVYFDGLNRYYVSQEKAELKQAFYAPPNVFDGFSVNGTASTALHRLLENRHAAEVSAQEQRASSEIAELKHTLSLRESTYSELAQKQLLQLNAHSAQMQELEQVLRAEILSLQTEVVRTSGLLIAAKDEFAGAFQATQQEAIRSVHAFATREREFADQAASLGQAHRTELLSLQAEVVRMSALLIATKDEFARALHVAQQEAVRSAQALAVREREFANEVAAQGKEHHNEIMSLHAEVARTSELLVTAKDELASLTRIAQQKVLEAKDLLSASEQRAQAQLNSFGLQERELRQQLLTKADEISRLQSEANLLAHNQQVREQGLLYEANERDAKLNFLEHAQARLAEEFKEQVAQAAKTVAQFQQMLSTARQEQEALQNTLSWRLTRPFRAIVQYLGLTPKQGLATSIDGDVKSKLFFNGIPEVVVQPQPVNADHHKLQKAYMSSADTPHVSPPNTSNAHTLAELLNLDGEQFIENTYLTLLKRPPDPPGAKFYHDKLLQGLAKIQILDEIGLSEEAQHSGVLNLAELLSLDGEQFIECAYYRLLKRLPDPWGGKSYLNKLLKGVAKIQILDEISASEEGVRLGVTLPGLSDAIARFKRAQRSRFRLFDSLDQNSTLESRMRGVEQRVLLLSSQVGHHFERVEQGLSDLRHLIIQQGQEIACLKESRASTASHATKSEPVDAMVSFSGSSSATPLIHGPYIKKAHASGAMNVPSIPSHHKTIYYFVDHTTKCPVNTGLQRVVRRLGRSLFESNGSIRFVKWDADFQALVLVNRDELNHLSKWYGPELNNEAMRVYPRADHPPVLVKVEKLDIAQWLVVPEVTHVTYHAAPVTLEVITAANRMGLKTAFIYYDAIPLRLPEYKDAAERHEMYMQHLLLADLIVPISSRSAIELTQFFKIHQRSRISTPRIKPIPLPGESQLSKRIYEASQSATDENFILSVGSIEPRKNQVALVKAFENFCEANPSTKWRLVLAGHLRGDVAAEINSSIARNSRISHVQSISDMDLDNLYRSCAFTVFPSVEEGFGLPILESLWYAKPCICANFGAMAEVAEGGGCYMVDTHQQAELESAISDLTSRVDLRLRLATEATVRSLGTWDDYSQHFIRLVDEESDPLRGLDYVFYWVDNTCLNPDNSGIQRVVRQLARALLLLGIKLVPFKWDRIGNVPYPPSPDELEHLFEWNGPSPDSWAAWVNPQQVAAGSWILIPELPHGILEHVKKYTSDNGLRCGAIFYDAIPWKMMDVYTSAFGEAHRKYMDELSRFDMIFPISNFSCSELVGFFLTTTARTHSLEHRIKTCKLPSEFINAPKATGVKTLKTSTIKILSVISIEPRKNPLVLLEAFAQASAKAKSKIELTLVGRKIETFAELSAAVDQKISFLDNATWERGVDDARLQALYAQSDFTIFPSIEEGFGLPILESLWNARPCICHNEGAMIEVAEGGGCLTIDVTDIETFSNAIVQLADDADLRVALASEASLRPIKSWLDYAKEIAKNMATDRKLVGKNSVHTISDELKMYRELVNLNKRPLLSICISTFNRAAWLAVGLRNLERLVPIPSDEIEILVCDNTSTDNTTDIVQPYLARSDFRYVRNEKNVGMLGNLRVTAHHARGRYIWILGDDDLAMPGSIEKILSIIRSNPELALIYLNYSYTRETDASTVKDLDLFFSQATTLIESSPDMAASVKEIATNNENLFTAIYCQVFRRDHALRAYSQNTDGRPFSTMRTSIPTTYYVLNFMMEESAYWVGTPQLVVNFNVSWNQYAALQILERVPEAQDLAERMGASPTEMDRWRENLIPGFVHYFTEMFENDAHGNAEFFSPVRVVARMKHLAVFKAQVPALRAVYESAHRAGHPAATMNTEKLFSAFSGD
jgi:FkbM family methyltransferase